MTMHRFSDKSRRKRAFTLLEILVSVGVIAIVAVTIIPLMSDDTNVRLSAAASILESDIEFLQVLNMSDPQNPMVLRMDFDQQAWWIAPAADPDRPILRPDGSHYVVAPGHARALSAAGVTFDAVDLDAGTDLRFSAMGGLTDPTLAPVIELHAGGKIIGLQIAPHTGRVTHVDLTPREIATAPDLGDGERR